MLEKLPFWKKDKRRIDKESLNCHIHFRITKTEEDFLNEQSEIQCRSKNSIIRELIKRKMKDIGKEVQP